jgi:hypothetical protein
MTKHQTHHDWGYSHLASSLNWMEQGACRGRTETMVPARFDDNFNLVPANVYERAVQAAKKYCDVCVVRTPCREFGLALSARTYQDGVLGGLTLQEREEIIG